MKGLTKKQQIAYRTLVACDWSLEAAAERLGVSRQTIHYLKSQLAKHGVNVPKLKRGRKPRAITSSTDQEPRDENHADWLAYVAGGRRDLQLRNRLVEGVLPYLRRLAAKMSRQFMGRFSPEELVSIGMVGVIQAAASYDPLTKYRFWTYAVTRARGAMLDEARAVDHQSRNARMLAKAYVELQDQYMSAGLSITLEQAALKLGVTPEKLRRATVKVRQFTLNKTKGSAVEEPGESEFHYVDLEDRLRDMCGVLDNDEFCLVHLYYARQSTMKRIGEAMGVSESRACQMHAQALQKIKARMSRNHVA